jgi:hypothetical protein
VRKLLKQMPALAHLYLRTCRQVQVGFHLPGKRQGMAPEVQRLPALAHLYLRTCRQVQVIATYLDQDRKAEIDWHDPAQRAAQLAVLVQDCETALELAVEHRDNDDVRATGWLLTKILGDNVVRGADGKSKIGEGTASARIISLTDTEMRHGRKSSAHRFDGHKAVVSTDQASEMILDVGDLAASEGDGKTLMPGIERVEEHAGVTVERALGDGAFGSGANRAACAACTCRKCRRTGTAGGPAVPSPPAGRPRSGQVRFPDRSRSALVPACTCAGTGAQVQADV